jgi:putative transposase
MDEQLVARLLKLFEMYVGIVNELLEYAYADWITSFYRLKAGKYYELRAKYPALPLHYIFTACQVACSIYRSFRKLRRKG